MWNGGRRASGTGLGAAQRPLRGACGPPNPVPEALCGAPNPVPDALCGPESCPGWGVFVLGAGSVQACSR